MVRKSKSTFHEENSGSMQSPDKESVYLHEGIEKKTS